MDATVTPGGEARAEILRDVTRILAVVVGEDWVDETPITMQTTFSRDLEVQSIELVVLFERLRERYGEGIDFPAWLTDMDTDRVMELTVGDLVDFISRCRSQP
jgi:acyl carrier protein